MASTRPLATTLSTTPQFLQTSSVVVFATGFTAAGATVFSGCGVAAAIGPVIDKLSLGTSPSAQAPFAFLFCQAAMMLGFWAVFGIIKQPISRAVFLTRSSWHAGGLIGCFATMKLGLKFIALQYCEHPAFLSVILFTDALWIILYYRITGRKDDSKIWAGLGIVACAAALMVVKSF